MQSLQNDAVTTAPQDVTKLRETEIPEQEYYNTVQSAAYLGFSKQRLDIWRCYGGGPKFVKLAQAVRYKRSDLDAFMAEHTKVVHAKKVGA